MTKTTKKFIQEVKDKKIKTLMGLTLDHIFFDDFLAENDEDRLRDELAEVDEKLKKENLKLSRDNKGKILADNRDMDKVTEYANEKGRLNKLTDAVVKIKQEKLHNEEGFEQITNYIDMVNNLSDEDIEKLGKLSLME